MTNLPKLTKYKVQTIRPLKITLYSDKKVETYPVKSEEGRTVPDNNIPTVPESERRSSFSTNNFTISTNKIQPFLPLSLFHVLFDYKSTSFNF